MKRRRLGSVERMDRQATDILEDQMTVTTCSMEIRADGEAFSMVDPHKADGDLLYNSMRYTARSPLVHFGNQAEPDGNCFQNSRSPISGPTGQL